MEIEHRSSSLSGLELTNKEGGANERQGQDQTALLIGGKLVRSKLIFHINVDLASTKGVHSSKRMQPNSIAFTITND